MPAKKPKKTGPAATAQSKAITPFLRDLLQFVLEAYPLEASWVWKGLVPFAGALSRAEDEATARNMLADALRPAFLESSGGASSARWGVDEVTPGVAPDRRQRGAFEALIDAMAGAVRRFQIQASLTRDERRDVLRGMILTRAVDNQLKAFFAGGEVRYGSRSFQGKGFRSLGQEAIYAAPLRLHRGESGRGDVVAPLIRDLGAVLAMRPSREMVRSVLNAQMGKAGPPMDGRDLHVGDMAWGIVPAAAPLAIPSLTVTGMALEFQRQGAPRIAVSFVGEGATSLGEWHEAINIAAVHQLPVIFCVQNNQTALSTPVRDQSAVRVFAEKAVGYGIAGITLDGTDPDRIAAAFAWAAERARAGRGPTLIELVAMRMCGHAHHDDMLYLGKEPTVSWEYPEPTENGYVDLEAYRFWSKRDPIARYAERLQQDGALEPTELAAWKEECADLVAEEARAVVDAPWPDPQDAGSRVYGTGEIARHRDPLDEPRQGARGDSRSDRNVLLARQAEDADLDSPFDPKGRTLLEAVMLGVADALRADGRVFVYGEDVGGRYGNAFLLLRPLLDEFGDRIRNSPLTEAGVLGVCVGAALAGARPIAEIQFNDFVATGFNQLVNNAAKNRYRWGGGVPMVVRMPWGGLRCAGPYHSQNTEAWFYRTPGLKIVVPSTPADARALMAAAVADPDPVLYYEHIALYREPKIKQKLGDQAPSALPLGRAAVRRVGDDLTVISYGAYVHVASRVAEALAVDGVGATVIDLRTLAPLDRDLVLSAARLTGRVLIVHEDTRTGSIGESLAAVIQEEAFAHLDAPVRIVGALDTPVPYAPSLEEAFLPSEERVLRAARSLLEY